MSEEDAFQPRKNWTMCYYVDQNMTTRTMLVTWLSMIISCVLCHCSDPSPAWFICPLELIPDVLSPAGLDVTVGSGITSTIAKRVWNNRLLHLKPVLLCQLFTLWIVDVNLCCTACWTQLRTRASVGSCIETWNACGTDADSVSTGCRGTGGGVNDA